MFDAQELVKGAIERHKGRIAVACSFGKDSMVVLKMALNILPNIPVIFENTGVEYQCSLILVSVEATETCLRGRKK